MEAEHKELIQQLVGKKIKVYFGFSKKVERVLREDQHGFYIRYDKQRVSVRLENNDSSAFTFIALKPKKTQQPSKQKKDDNAVKTENSDSHKETKPNKVVSVFEFYQRQFRKSVRKIRNGRTNMNQTNRLGKMFAEHSKPP